MNFTERIKQLCEDRQIPQRKLAEALDIAKKKINEQNIKAKQ